MNIVTESCLADDGTNGKDGKIDQEKMAGLLQFDIPSEAGVMSMGEEVGMVG